MLWYNTFKIIYFENMNNKIFTWDKYSDQPIKASIKASNKINKT